MTTRLALVAIVLSMTSPALALDISAPGVTVPRGQTGVVQNDLTCGPGQAGILLETGAKLELNGHTLQSCSVVAVDAVARVSVRGPGTIREGSISIRGGLLRVQDVFVEDAPTFGISGSTGSEDGPSTIKLRDVMVDDSGLDGIWATRVIGENVNVTGSGVDAYADGIVGFGGVNGRNFNVTGSSGEGVFAASGSIKLKASQVTDNFAGGVLGFGVSRSAVILIASIVTGNDANGAADVVSQVLPRVRNTTCGSSLDSQNMVPWGVCTND